MQAKEKTCEADVVVYGDASGGVTAAVQAARMGKRVILVSPFGHLGGMTASGLGWTDIGNTAILGGLSREFYHRVYLHYQDEAAWAHQPREAFHNRGQAGGPALDPETRLASTFEPKVAEAVFDALVKEAGVAVIKGRLDLAQGVEKQGTRITALRLEGGTVVSGRMFIDASYEGDLLASAGVSFMLGREANAEYGETGNGITGPLHQNQLPEGLDPYVVKGDPASGLLPGVNPDMGGEVGDADHRLQAYCYRMVLTDVAANHLPIPKPEHYDEADYEILFRAIEAGQRKHFFKTDLVPNRKTDANNTGGISCDLIGGNYGKDWNWATLNHQERETLADKHRDWQLGLVWTLQHHPRVPEKLRADLGDWGLAKDEFVDNRHWPYNIYVREARRMKSGFVMTEKHCRRELPVADPVGMGAYTLDSHNTQRFVHQGMVKNEGDIQRSLGGKPYGISYRALVPAAGECTNLLVPWALSATHIAFGSIRMEPVFMALGQSAATAACLAIDAGIRVQDVPYPDLRARLLADDQRLGQPPPPVAIDANTIKSWSAPFRGWHYHPDHVIPEKPGIKGFEEVHMTDVPTVYQRPGDDTWYMSFIGFDGQGYQSFVAESDDLVNWGNMRLAMGYGKEGEFDFGGRVIGAFLYEDYDIKARRTLKRKDGKYISLYGAYPKQGGYELRPGYEGLAASADGLTWQRANPDPILSVFQEGCAAWEQDCIYQPWLVEHEGKYFNFYNAARGNIEQLGAAFSDDLRAWTRYRKNPVIPVGAEGSYNAKFSSDGKVFWDTDHWVMFFFGVGRGGAHIMAAYSRDLLHWTADPDPLYQAGGNPSGLDKQYAHKISLVWNPANDTYYMFYNAVGKQGRGIGLITSKPLDTTR